MKMPLNKGTAGMATDGFTVTIDWNPADGGATTEVFLRLPSASEMMAGTSNCYGPFYRDELK
jgi:hypothetical protein